jgi:hypothetical protein
LNSINISSGKAPYSNPDFFSQTHNLDKFRFGPVSYKLNPNHKR